MLDLAVTVTVIVLVVATLDFLVVVCVSVLVPPSSVLSGRRRREVHPVWRAITSLVLLPSSSAWRSARARRSSHARNVAGFGARSSEGSACTNASARNTARRSPVLSAEANASTNVPLTPEKKEIVSRSTRSCVSRLRRLRRIWPELKELLVHLSVNTIRRPLSRAS
jgi:hypothetical protein